MRVPKYVQEMMARSRYEYDFCRNDVNYAAGYTVRIRKRSPYTTVDAFKKELCKLCGWADRITGMKSVYVLDIPDKTHYCNQAAVVTIFDPVMKHIEIFIPKEK